MKDLLEGKKLEVRFADQPNSFIRLVDTMPRCVPDDVMTGDFAVVQAARVSFGQGTTKASDDRTLLRYLMRHFHSTPTEMIVAKWHMSMPIFIARQFIRHRTACLSGDSLLHFDLPGGIERRGNQLYKLSLKQVYDKFQPTKGLQGNPVFKRERVQKMQLRCLNEDTQEIIHTGIVDIWESGVKPVYRVCLKNGASLKMSKDHLCKTDKGWRRLEEVASLPLTEANPTFTNTKFVWVGPGKGSVPIRFNETNPDTEEWLPVVGWESYYEVSDQGRIRRTMTRWSPSIGRCKQLTVSAKRAVVSLNKPGVQEVRLVHHLVLEAFVGPCPPGLECCHNDGNSLNNTVENLRWGSCQSNADDRIRDGSTTELEAALFEVVRIEYAGEEMTYDIEVAGRWHNFAVEGFIVHNSVNEESGRYSIMKEVFYVPTIENMRKQSNKNKQGGSEPMDVITAQELIDKETEHDRRCYELYQERIAAGMARELARDVLPLNLYTSWFWSCSMWNTMNFLRLRMDSHAQYEIRELAGAMYELLKPIYPDCIEAFDDYINMDNVISLTRLEVARVKSKLFVPQWFTEKGKPTREEDEFQEKLVKLGLKE